MRVPDDGTNWICSSDRNVRRPYAEAVAHTSDGIPYLRPELVLLYKGLHPRPKDEADFEGTAPLLTADARSWLARALAEARGEGHPWVAVLT